MTIGRTLTRGLGQRQVPVFLILYFLIGLMPGTEVLSAPAAQIQGIVIDITPDLSTQNLDKIEKAVAQNSEEELGTVLAHMYKRDKNGRYLATAVVPGIQVTAKTGSIIKNVVTDKEGQFYFNGLEAGDYELSVEGKASGEGKRLASPRPVKVFFQNQSIASRVLPVRSDLITITGRITDEQGRPVAGARVRGEPYPMPESTEAAPPTRFALSNQNGVYALSGFSPAHLHRVAGFLNGGDPTEFGSQAFYVDIHVDAEGYVQGRDAVPRVVPLTEELVGAARRYLKILVHWAAQKKEKSKGMENLPNVPLPSIQAHTITGIDVVLKSK